MYIPHAEGTGLRAGRPFYDTSFSFDVASSGSPPGGWQSIIGIVTAIIGNVLISFALNTQRYAHIRIARENEAEEDEQKYDKKRRQQENSQDSQQIRVAEEQAKKHLKVRQDGGLHDQYRAMDGVATERDPLLAATGSRRSSDSESTIRADNRPIKKKSYLSSPWWWGGIGLMTVGECGNFLAYGFAPASIVSPLGVVALVSNCLIAPLMLHERFRIRDALGVVVAVGGCVTVVLSASGSNPKLDADKIWHLISRWEFETYFGITLFLIIVLMAASNKYGQKSIFIDIGLVGLFGGYTALSTKGVASLLSNTIWRVFTFPITYLLIAVLVSTAVMQIKYINRALQRFDSTQVIPTQFVMFTLSVIIGSAVLYRDFERTTAEDAGKFVGGCVLTFAGVWCITSGRDKGEDSSDSERDKEEEDVIDLLDEEGEQPEIREREDEDNDRRRSSLQPPSPHRLRPTRSTTPSITFTQADEEVTGFNFGEPSPFNGDNPWTAQQIPANISAIHPPSSNATQTIPADSTSAKPPRFHATTSMPVLPTASTLPRRPKTPTRNSSPFRQERPRTPENRNHLDPPTPSPSRFASMNRHSIADMLPGPLMAPLSSSLSAIVADSLRRGIDGAPALPRGASFKRRRSSRRLLETARRLSAAEAGGAGVDDVLEEEVATGLAVGAGLSAAPGRPGLDSRPSMSSRGRSFSATVGDLFRTKRQRRGTLEGAEEGTR